MVRVLVVEDSPSQALEVAYILEEAGMEAVLADDGEQALAALKQDTFDLVLSDIQMPGMSGYDLCRRIRSQPETHKLPVVLLTTLTSPSDILRGLECMADNYVTKPYSPEYLLDRIQSAIANRQQRADRPLSVGLHVTLHDEQYHLGPDLEKTLDFLITTIEECMRMREMEHERRLAIETQRFFTVSLELLAIVDNHGRFSQLNPAWAATLGHAAEDMLAHPWSDFVHADDVEAGRRHMTFGGASLESRFRCQDGTWRRLLWSVAPAGDTRYLAARDITFRANEEDAARLRARLQTAMASLGQQALVETDIAVLKAAAARLVREALDTDECTVVDLQVDGTLLLGNGDHWPGAGAAPGDVMVSLADEAGQGMASSASVVIPGRGVPHGVLMTHCRQARSFGEEETAFLEGVATLLASAIARTGAEEELRKSEERNRLLLDSTAEAIYGLDLKGQCTFCNPAALKLLGYQRSDQLLGRQMHDLIHHSREDGTPYPRHECPVERGEAVHVDDEVLWRADGSYFHAEYWSYPVRRGTERLGGVVTFLDITSRRLLEQQFRHAQKMEAVGRLAGGVAHDFNNLLTVVSGYCTLLEEEGGVSTAEGRDMLGEINKAAGRATALTRQLLTFSRRQVSRPRQVDLNVAVLDMEKLLQRLVGTGVRLVAELAPGPLLVRADPNQLEQVLVNLIVNARDAMPRGGTILVSTSSVALYETSPERPPDVAPGQYRLLLVRDTGLGIPPDVLTHIFEPFFTTKEEGKGTGLGLSTVFGIVQQSRAHIEVASEVGRGTTFTLYFRPAEGVDVAPARLGTLSSIIRGAETVLLVKTDPELRKLATMILERNGYKVLVAESGATALAIARSYSDTLHLLLTDLDMMDMGAKEFLDQWLDLRPGVPVLITSGELDPSSEKPDSPLPSVQFLQMPYPPDALLRSVRRCLDGEDGDPDSAATDQDVA